MSPHAGAQLTSIVLVSFVFGLFVFAAALRIRDSWRALHSDKNNVAERGLRKLDLVFSSIFLTASVVFYSVFILNIGKS